MVVCLLQGKGQGRSFKSFCSGQRRRKMLVTKNSWERQKGKQAGQCFGNEERLDSCLYFLLFHVSSCLAKPFPPLRSWWSFSLRTGRWWNLQPHWPGSVKGLGMGDGQGENSDSTSQVHIRRECLPGKSELPWKSEFSSPENTGIYGGKGPQDIRAAKT